jgi:[protein-PII] uridylyltransferase
MMGDVRSDSAGRLFVDIPLYENGAPITRERFLSLSRDYVALLKNNLLAAREKVPTGRSYVRAYTGIVDAIVRVLFERAIQEHKAKTENVELAVIGLGGYGRSELTPYSDVDILVLCRRKTPLVKRIAGSFVQLMWDVGFETGHTVQSLVESKTALSKYMDARTALFESRYVCGSETIGREAERQKKRLMRSDRAAFIEQKIRDVVTRHGKYGRSYQLIEPNVKLSPGGMRDFQTLVWLGMVLDGENPLGSLQAKGLLLPGEAKTLEDAYEFLLKVRVELHVCSESKHDQLTVRMQQSAADRLGYKAKGEHLAVELFMRDYYGRTRTIYRITKDIVEKLLYRDNIRLVLGRGGARKLQGRFAIRVDPRRLETEPLYVFARQKETGLELDRSVCRRLEDALSNELSGTAERKRMRKDFLALVADPKNLTLALRSMHDTGFLGAIIPEYNLLTSLKRYDLYHHFTVDEHSFQVVRCLEELAKTGSKRGDPFVRIYSEIADKQTLHLAALLHDVGKIEGRGHAKKGAALAREILSRMQLKETQVEMVSHLIEIHLLMAHYSQRRDPTDIGTLQSFCSRVKTRTTLKHLLLLTYADLKATSPHAWTEWKRTLLWGFYLRAYQFLATKEKKPETVYKSRKASILRGFLEGAARAEALAHLDKLPGRYLLNMKASQVRRHIELIRRLDGERSAVGWKKGALATEVCFCTYDKPFRLSQLCGVLTLNDCNILYADAFTRADGIVVDVFYVEDVSGVMPVDAERVEKIGRDLGSVVRGSLDIHSALERHVVKWRRKKQTAIPIPFRVEFHNDISPDVTIIDIFATDEPGLLYKITRALSEEGLVIYRARISTEAHRAIDSFDVQERAGSKITSAARLQRIRDRLEERLGG